LVGLSAFVFFSATCAVSCATSSSDSDGGDGDDDDGETIETKDDECTASQFDCGGGTCIAKTYVCDGTPQCDDASDEPPINTECPGSNCEPGEFECSPTQCIPSAAFCDGFTDCDDGSDETPGCADQCALPNPSAPTTCDDACNDLFDCGLLNCPGGGQLCPAFNEAGRSQFMTTCLPACESQMALISLVTPEDCNSTIDTMAAVDGNFAAACVGGKP
jgi:hypothetical protein